MRKVLLFAFFGICLGALSQAPQKINYQGVVRDGSGTALANAALTLTIDITSGTYIEKHSVTSNAVGIFTLHIGSSSSVLGGSFAAINWGSTANFITVTIDAGSGPQTLGTQQLVSVPYALYAEKAGAAPSPTIAYSGGVLTVGTNSTSIPSSSYTAGSGIAVGSGTISNTAPDQIVSISSGTNIIVIGTYPNFTVSSTNTLIAAPNTSLTGTGAATVTAIGTNSFNIAVATPSLTGAGSTTVSGSYPNFTITTPTTSSNSWAILGNSGTTDGTNFIGTTDNVPLNFRVNNLKAGRIDPLGPTFFGFQSGNSNTDINSTGFGHRALFANTTGSLNSAFGKNALTNNTTGSWNSAFGNEALLANTTGSYNDAFGRFALRANTTGSLNAAFGNWSLGDNSTGNNNSAFGYWALTYNTTGDFNTAIGSRALAFNQSGIGNTAVGFGAINSNTLSNFSTGVGYNSLKNNTGGWSIGIGADALFAATTSTGNVTLGNATFSANVVGIDNTGVGHAAGMYNTGSGNVFLGYRAGQNELGSNKLYIANSPVNPPLIYGDFSTGRVGIGTTTPAYVLELFSPSTAGLLKLTTPLSSTQITMDDAGANDVYLTSSLGDFDIWTSNLKRVTVLTNGNVGIRTTTPASALHVNGQVTITDGTQGAGLVLTSNPVGNASWQKPVNYVVTGFPIQTLAATTNTPTMFSTSIPFTKANAASVVEIMCTFDASVNSMTANGVIIEIKIDGIASLGNAKAVYFSNFCPTNQNLTIAGVFPGLAPGPHNVQFYAYTLALASAQVIINSGGWVPQLIIKEN